MSLRLEMLQVSRLASKVLGDSTTLVRDFLRSQENAKGGFKDRAGRTDLYYTVFGVDSVIALQDKPQGPLIDYLNQWGAGDGLDFVHLCCLARCWAACRDLRERNIPLSRPPDTLSPSEGDREGRGGMFVETALGTALARGIAAEILQRVERFRSADGGYDPLGGGQFGSVYGCFLAFGAYQDLNVPMPDPERLAECLQHLETPDGAWANDRVVKLGSTNATAAALMLLRQLGLSPRSSAVDWLLARVHSEGGFRATPQAPVPDLLSTATALHALAGLQVDLHSAQEPCLDFIDTLWTNQGSFHGSWADDDLDCEYTFYGLLALGHLSA